MIEKNIRLQPHHSRDLLVGRRSDGKRPKYQPPGGGATSMGSGRDVGGGGSRNGGGGARYGRSAALAAQAAAAANRAAAAQRAEADRQTRVAEQAAAERQRVIQAENIRRASELVNRDQTGGVTLGEGMPKELNTVTSTLGMSPLEAQARGLGAQHHGSIRSSDLHAGNVGGPDAYYPGGIGTVPGMGYVHAPPEDWYGTPDEKVGPRKDILPEFVPRKTTTITGGNPFIEGPYEKKIVYEPREGPARTYDPRTDPNALLDRGSGSMGTIGGIGKKVFGETPLDWALTLGTAGGSRLAGLAKTAKAYFPEQMGDIKTALTSNLRSTIDKGTDLRSRPKGMPEHLGERGFRTRRETPTRDGEGPKTIAEQVTQGAGLEEGAETLGITDEQREQYLLMQNKMKTALDQGSYINAQGQTIQLNEQQMDQLQKYIDNLNRILGTVLQGAAHGGRIDQPLTGRSRYL